MKVIKILMLAFLCGAVLPLYAQQKKQAKKNPAQKSAPVKEAKKSVQKPGETVTLPSGLKYRFIKHSAGPNGKVHDIVELNVLNKTAKDSILFNTFDGNSEPLAIEIVEPKFHGDFMEALPLVSKGDSLEIWSSVDSLSRQVQLDPHLMEQGPYMHYIIKVYDVMTPDAYKQKRQQFAQQQLAKDTLLIKKYLKENGIKALRTSTGLYYSVSQSSDGQQAMPGDTVTVNYTGMLLDGRVFDSSIPRHEPIKFRLGIGQVIRGWDEGLTLLKKGEKAKLLIPSGLAYGKVAPPGSIIPANAVLIFDVELVDIKR